MIRENTQNLKWDIEIGLKITFFLTIAQGKTSMQNRLRKKHSTGKNKQIKHFKAF